MVVDACDTRSLPYAALFFQHHADNALLVHFANQDLSGERTERSLGVVEYRLRWRRRHDSVRELYHRALPFSVQFFDRKFRWISSIPSGNPDHAGRMSIEFISFNLEERACSHPVALVIGHEQFIVGGDYQSARRTKSICIRDELTAGRQLRNPAAIWDCRELLLRL